MVQNRMEEAALRYAGMGFAVLTMWRPDPATGMCRCWRDTHPRNGQFHCRFPGKHPRSTKGVNAATTDPEKIRRLKWDGANVGIATGKRSGVIVLDVDPRHDGDKSLARLEQEFGGLPEGPMDRSGGGGPHLWFRYREGWDKPTKSFEREFPGIDLLGDQKIVVAPPSLHVTGNRSKWIIQLRREDLPNLPDS